MYKNNPYTGDSPAKKITRLMIWWTIRPLLSDFKKGKYLVLASREAGDVGVLQGLGVPLKQITAVDWDQQAAAAARLKFPGLEVQEGDVGSLVDQIHGEPPYSCALLDFCAQTTVENFDRVVNVALKGVRNKGLIGCAFQVGREKSTRADVLELKNGLVENIKTLPAKEKAQWEGSESFLSRAYLIEKELWERGLAKNCLIMPKAFFFYQGKTEQSKGHPFCTYLATVMRVKEKVAQDFKARHLPEPRFHHYEEDTNSLREYAMMLLEDGERADLLLNLSPSTIAAWKAHATRGTYKKRRR